MITLFSFSSKNNDLVKPEFANEDLSIEIHVGTSIPTKAPLTKTYSIEFDKGYPIVLNAAITGRPREGAEAYNNVTPLRITCEHIGMIPIQITNVLYDFLCSVYSDVAHVQKVLNDHPQIKALLKTFGYEGK